MSDTVNLAKMTLKTQIDAWDQNYFLANETLIRNVCDGKQYCKNIMKDFREIITKFLSQEIILLIAGLNFFF